ncbi:ANTAR domain-containing protein [Parafrankia sp. FMc2]|uniref:ANTAR domain-containing protein n=1 Tax=Parafrankia sp. FMc2 TaxID=3233196 RepID=UPI003B587754
MSSAPSGLPWSTVDAALRATHALHQLEQTCLVAVSATDAVYLRVTGPIPELVAGLGIPRARCLPARMLDGAPAAGSRADQEPALADTVEVERFGIRSHVSMPILGPDGTVLGILAGLDRSPVEVPAESLGVLRAIADSLGASDTLREQLARQAHAEVAASNGSGADRQEAAAEAAAAVGRVGSPGGAVSPTGHPPATPPPPVASSPEVVPPAAPGTAAPAEPRPAAVQPSAPATGSSEATGGVSAPIEPERPPATGQVQGPGQGQPGPAPTGGVSRVTPEVLARTARPGPTARAGTPRPAPPRSGPPRAGAARGQGGPSGPSGGSVPGASDMRLRRASAGWVVEGPGSEVRPVGDLISAMVLADLLADDLSPPGRPRRADRDLNETEQLRLSVIQLEHALASRVIVEQAIGVLAERNHIKPRDAFERLRRTARGMGRRVHDLARQVVESVGDPRINLPGELGRGNAGPPPGASPAGGGAGGGSPRPSPPRATPSRH